MWKMIGEVLETADGTGVRVFQKAIMPRNTILNGARAQLIFYNDPVFTAITMKVYSNNAGSPQALIATSTNSVAKASILLVEDHAVKEIYFNFNSVALKANETYHFVIGISGYTGSVSTHVAWKHSFPDPAYQTNVNMTYAKQLISPFDITLIGSYL